MSILDACTTGDLESVRAILAENPDAINDRDPNLGSTPLIFAAHRGFTEIVQVLLEAGAIADDRELASQTTPLHWAAEGGHPEIIQMLVDAGANLEAKDEWFALTPLGWSTIVLWAPQFHEDRQAAAELLKELGSEVDPFMAIVHNDSDALYAAAERIEDRLGIGRQGQTPLQFAISRGNEKMVRQLLDMGADFNAVTWWGVSALAIALENEFSAIADILVKHGAEMDLSAALFSGDLEAARQIPYDPELHGYLLHACTLEGLDDAVDVLLEMGADANLQTPMLMAESCSSVTPLHIAALEGHVGIATELLSYGADANALAEGTNQTPLHCAASNGHLEVAELLLGYGANKDARDLQYDSTPGEWAEFARHREVAELLGVPMAEEEQVEGASE